MIKTSPGRLEVPKFLSPIRIGFLYLLIPFLIFSIGFIKLIYSIPMVLLLILVAAKYWNQSQEDLILSFESKKDLLIGSSILFFWIVLSGIGSFAFQNPDFHGRNAIFRDLVTMDWPVIYTDMGQNASSSFGLRYYFGFWLPSALFGKLLGWKMANIALFIWTLIGVHISSSLIMKKTKLSFTKSTLLLIFFSGMDFAGVLVTHRINSDFFATIWPPIKHLEFWAADLQLSSFTTQLFWVFNQAIPAWIALLITINLTSKKSIFLILALCAFLSPMPAIGLVFITVLIAFTHRNQQENKINLLRKRGLNRFSKIVLSESKEIISVENCIGGGLILLTSLMFYYSHAGKMLSPISAAKTEVANFYLLLFVFTIVDWFYLWLVLFDRYKQDKLFYLIGAFLLFVPLLNLYGSEDLTKRATIPMLLMLLVWCGEYLRSGKGRHRILVIILLLLGSLTPIFEINRSIYRTSSYYIQNRGNPPATQSLYLPNSSSPRFIPHPELDHPEELIADEWYTLSVFNPELLGNYLVYTSDSFFYQYIAKQ